jgi:hypothetical protein
LLGCWIINLPASLNVLPACLVVVGQAAEGGPSLSHLWVLQQDPAVTGLAPEAQVEALALADEVRNRSVVVQLSHALLGGKATGVVGSLNIATVEVGDLDTAIAYVGCWGGVPCICWCCVEAAC